MGKRLLATLCAVILLITSPGVAVLADESISDEFVSEQEEGITNVSEQEEDTPDVAEPEEDTLDVSEPKEVMEEVSVPEEDAQEIKVGNTSVADDAETEILEEAVGTGDIVVGDNVTATFNSSTGAVRFYSNGGILWKDWVSKSGIYKYDIHSIEVVSGPVYLPPDSSSIFKICDFEYKSNLLTLDLKGFDTSKVTNMDCMFAWCDSLTTLDLSHFDTSKVTSMSGMFSECSSLTNLDLSSFDTLQVTNMSGMFSICSSLKTLNLSSFNTSKVTDMSAMFSSCDSLTTLDLSHFDTSKVTDMRGLFQVCERLTNLDISGFDTSKVTDMRQMFSHCDRLINLDLSGFNTSNVMGMDGMFCYCSSLTNLDLSSFDTSKVTDMGQMFFQCESLINLDLSGFNTSKVRNMSEMFRACRSLTNLNLSSFNMSNVTADLYHFYDMFSECSSLQILITPNISPKRNYVELPFSMYDFSGNSYEGLPLNSSSIILTKEPRQNMGQTKIFKVPVMDEDNKTKEEEIIFQWDVDKLVYAGKEYDYDLALAAAYLCQGAYYGAEETHKRMESLGFSDIDDNRGYDDFNVDVPWMSVGSQSCVINGIKKTIICLNVRGTLKVPADQIMDIIHGLKGFDGPGKAAYQFLEEYCSTPERNIELSNPDTILFLIGHSLGGATVARMGFELLTHACKAKPVIYTFGSPNYKVNDSIINPPHLHSVFNAGDTVYLLGGPDSSHVGQLIKFAPADQHVVLDNLITRNDNHEIMRYIYRIYHSRGKIAGSLSQNRIEYNIQRPLKEELCLNDPQTPLTITNNIDKANSNALGTKYCIRCPVDVSVYNSEGVLVGDSTNEDILFADGSGGYINVNEDEKYVFLPTGSNYRIVLSGTDGGTMNVDAVELDIFGDETNRVSYENVTIETDKQFMVDAQSVNTVEESGLYVVEDNDVPVAVVQSDGTEISLLGSGLVGEGVTWSVDSAGRLVISGKGEIPSISRVKDAPWYTLSDQITSVAVNDGITSIGAKAFSNLANMENATITSTVTKIGTNAFAGCSGLESVLFYGNLPEIDTTAFINLSPKILYYGANNTWENKPDLGTGITYTAYCGFSSEGILLEHSYKTKIVKPGCGIGYTLYRCENCGYAYATDFVEGLDHDWGDWEVTKEVTADAEGEEQRICRRCMQTETRTITRKDISECTVTLSTISYTYNGKARKPAVTVKDGDTTLTSGTDYTVSYANNKNAGTATVKVTGIEKYTGEKTATFKINKAAAKLAFESDSISKTIRDGAFINTLTATTDGALTYKSSNDAVATVDGDGFVTIKEAGITTITVSAAAGKNYKAGSAGYTLTVTDGRIDISTCTVTLSATSYTYNGSAKKPTVTVKDGSTTLTSGTDYTAGYKNNTNAGTATVTITGKGNYTGSINKTFTIKKAAPSLKFDENTVSKSALDDAFTNELTHTTDGTVTFTSNDNDIATVDSTSGLVTIKGAGTAVITATAAAGKNYNAGNASYTLIIMPESMEKSSIGGVSLSYGYSGKAYTPTVTVKVDGVTLTKGTDYSVKYENNVKPGTAKITVTGKGKYTGTKTKTFEIVDCVSSVVSGKTYMLIPKNNSKTAVCAVGGKMVNNTKVYITDRGNSESQKFKAVKNSDGTWKFINAKCELALAVQQNSSALGAGLVLYDQTTRPAQNWKLSKKADNSFAIINSVTGYSIAMSDKSAAKGTTLSMAETASVGQQRFYIVETSAVSAPFDGTKSIRAAKNKNFAVNISSASKEDGANVSLYTYTNSNARKFKIIYSGGGYYRLVNVNSGLCLTIKDNSNADGANVIQSKWKGYSSQRWKITKNSDGTVTITNMLGTVLHLLGNRTVNNTNIHARKAASTTAQKWYLN